MNEKRHHSPTSWQGFDILLCKTIGWPGSREQSLLIQMAEIPGIYSSTVQYAGL
jgi:hypothetical protein